MNRIGEAPLGQRLPLKRGMKSVSGLYAITPDCADTAVLCAMVSSALAGGVRVVQYRNKTATPALRRAQAVALLELCRARSALLIVNDDVALACAIGADGVHIGADDPALAEARARVGDEKIIGVSCYDQWNRAVEAAACGADYVAFGSMYASRVKPGAVRAPLQLLSDARTRLGLPVVAIGGINTCNAGALIDAGADAIAVISALFDAPDVEAAARNFTRLFSDRPHD